MFIKIQIKVRLPIMCAVFWTAYFGLSERPQVSTGFPNKNSVFVTSIVLNLCRACVKKNTILRTFFKWKYYICLEHVISPTRSFKPSTLTEGCDGPTLVQELYTSYTLNDYWPCGNKKAFSKVGVMSKVRPIGI